MKPGKFHDFVPQSLKLRSRKVDARGHDITNPNKCIIIREIMMGKIHNIILLPIWGKSLKITICIE